MLKKQFLKNFLGFREIRRFSGIEEGSEAKEEKKKDRFDMENYVSILGAPQIDSPLSWKSQQEIMLQRDPLYYDAVKSMVDKRIVTARSLLQKCYQKYLDHPESNHSILYNLNSK